jgi:hypothetical protein
LFVVGDRLLYLRPREASRVLALSFDDGYMCAVYSSGRVKRWRLENVGIQ